MMNETYIRNFAGQAIGIIRDEGNGDKSALTYPGRQVLGYYRAKYDHTTDFFGRVLSRGDTVVALIYDDLEKKKRK